MVALIADSVKQKVLIIKTFGFQESAVNNG